MTPIVGHRVLRLLDAGSAAEVDEVLTPEGERRTPKRLESGLAPTFVSCLQGRQGPEGEGIALTEHVNVWPFHDAGLIQGRAWLFLELLDALDLRPLAERNGGTLTVVRALRLVEPSSGCC